MECEVGRRETMFMGMFIVKEVSDNYEIDCLWEQDSDSV